MTGSTERKTIGLYGGSFNPPHVAHVLAVGWALSAGELSEVWVIPTGGHPFGKSLADFDDRLTMCRLAFACYGDRVRILDIERGPEVHYSVDTVEQLVRENPDCSFRWIIGSDAMAQSAEWKNFARLAELAPPLVVGRSGHGTKAKFTLPDISSTMLRERIARADDLRELDPLVPRSVLNFISHRKLYR